MSFSSSSLFYDVPLTSEKIKVEAAEDIKEFVDEEGIRWTREKRRPPINLLNHYVCSWKTRNNHFLRYSDVKPKGELYNVLNTRHVGRSGLHVSS